MTLTDIISEWVDTKEWKKKPNILVQSGICIIKANNGCLVIRDYDSSVLVYLVANTFIHLYPSDPEFFNKLYEHLSAL